LPAGTLRLAGVCRRGEPHRGLSGKGEIGAGEGVARVNNVVVGV
jgi:hypothetical protein